MNQNYRRQFDTLLEDVIAQLPEQLHEMLEEVPLIVEDEPSQRLKRELEMSAGTDLCGLHSGVALTHRSVEAPPHVPDHMMLFRGPIRRVALGETARSGEPLALTLREQIRVTLLHEIGHHFGLDEEDLERLGYG